MFLVKKLAWAIPLVIILVVSFFAYRPLLNSGFFSMHDDQQVARLFELNKALLARQFPVRWVAGLGFGYGYALFNFYPPFVYYLGELFHLGLHAGYIDSIKLVWFTALVGSGISMYFLSRKFFGSVAGIVCALFYIYAPYHAVDAYVRGALAELFSFVWLPLILLFSFKSIVELKTLNILLTGILLAFLMITHNLIFLPFAGLYVIWSTFIVLTHRKNISIPFALLSILFPILIAFALTAFFWLPALAEKQFTLVDQLLIKNLASYTIHFVCPTQLWNSVWGYGGSVPGCLDGVSFKIGKIHIVLAALSLVVAAYLWIKKNHKLSLAILTAFSLFLLCAFLSTQPSKPIWDLATPLWYLQFPWRFLEFVALFASLLAGAIFSVFKNIKLQIPLAIGLISVLLLTNIKLFTPQTYLLSATDEQLTSDQEIKWHVSSTSFEFMPRGVKTKLTDMGVVWVDINQNQIATTDYKLISGDWQQTSSKFIPDSFVISGKSNQGATLQAQITNFPGWTTTLDGKPISLNDNNKYKLITITIPPGAHKVAGRLENTPVRNLGNVVTLISIFLTAAALLYGTRRNSRQNN